MDDQDTPSGTTCREEHSPPPAPLHPNVHPHYHGPGPELDNSAMELQRITLLHSHAKSPVINNHLSRTSEPDNDVFCVQPEQLRRRQQQQQPQVMQQIPMNKQPIHVQEESIREDSSTIFSLQTGNYTMDTDTTVQRGSRSKKPSPDPDVQPQPVVRKHSDDLGAIEQPHHHHNCKFVPSGRNMNDEDMPSSLSFPSPPSVEDEELPTQKTATSSAGASVISAVQESIRSAALRQEEESSSSSSNRTGAQEGNEADKNSKKTTTNTKDKTLSRRKRVYTVLISLLLLVIVITVSMKATKKKKNSKGKGRENHDGHHHDSDSHHQSSSSLDDSLSTPLESEWVSQEQEQQQQQPSSEAGSNAATIGGLDDHGEGIAVVSANITSGNSSSPMINQTDDNETLDDESSSTSAPSSISVFTEEQESSSPTVAVAQSEPTQPDVPTRSSLRGKTP